MSDKKNNKKKLLWIALGALGLAIAGTATGVAISKSLSKDKVKDKRESLKEILADKNLNIPSNMKEYLQELSQSESFDNSLNIEDIKSSLINWTVIEKYSKELENEKVNIEFIEFLENTNNLKINDVKAEKNNLEKLLNNKNANSITELINNKSKIKELENQLGQFASGTQNSQEDFNKIKAILSKNPPIISSDSIDSYKTTMKNDYKANSSLKSSLKNIIDIDSKARELISVANEIKAKETKNEKQHAALIKFANIFNDSNQVKEDKFADSSLLEEMIILISDFNNALKPENPNNDSGNVNNNPSQDGGEEKTIEQEKNEAKAFVSSLEKLSDALKIKYSEKINDLTISASIKEVKDRASSYNQVVDKIISAISKANEVKQTQKYNNASNKDEFDAKLVEIQNLLEENKLKTNDEFLELNSKLEDIKNDLEKLEELKNELNGDISSDKINEFKSMVENSLTSSISDRVNAYGMENLLYSASITSENKPLFISENEVDGVELEFKNVYVSDDNINELNVVYKAKSKTDESLVTEVTEKVLFSNDFNEKVNAITFTNLDELFEFEYNDFNK
ncbi:hypothetical protein [Mycoplasmopsis canis]|uniref:hypothetical protein n=1 Tax=Mycoplasmopsis canis TaxID=29555 RepID=UPI00025AF7B4|nr:hypothetical protein [Mycoplasmopsis canis]EIE40233.1 hypothetical protein MCANUF33_01941 [Mycoplasmopsis canis UF33]